MTENSKKILELIEGLSGDASGDLPGLSVQEVAENFVDVKYKDELAKVGDADERKALRDKWLKYYTDGEGRGTLQMEISSITSNYTSARDSIKAVIESSACTVATNTIPSVITTGAAASVPNPAYALAENKTKKNQLLSQLGSIDACLVNMLKSAFTIEYPIPTSVTTLIDTFNTAKSTVESIPV